MLPKKPGIEESLIFLQFQRPTVLVARFSNVNTDPDAPASQLQVEHAA